MSDPAETKFKKLTMNPELTEEWIDALTGGDYTQCTGHLKKDNQYDDGVSYCCLGVLMDISGMRIDKDQQLPMSKELGELGLSYEAAMELGGLNDNGRTFNEIVAYIQRNLFEK